MGESSQPEWEKGGNKVIIGVLKGGLKRRRVAMLGRVLRAVPVERPCRG